MANHETNFRIYNEILRKYEITDEVHADVFNETIKQLIDNDMYLYDHKGSVVAASVINGKLSIDGVAVTIFSDAELKSRIGTAEAEIEQLSIDMQDTSTSLAGTSTELQDTIDDLNDLSTDVISVRSNITTINTSISNIQSDLTDINTDIAVMATGIEDISTDILGIDTSISAINLSITNLTNLTANVSKTKNLIDIEDYKISGSVKTTPGSISASSNTLIVSSVDSFEVGQYVAVAGAAKENFLSFIEIQSAPTASGTLTISSGASTATYTITAKPEIWDLTFGGTSEREGQFGISLEWNTKYITLYNGETAATFATRIATDSYFTNLWTGWTISTPSANTVRFTSTTSGARKYGMQIFGFGALWGSFSEFQEGTGSISSVKNTLNGGANIPGWTKYSVADPVLAYECSTPGAQTALTYNPGITGIVLNIKTMKSGVGELTSKITAINPTTKAITLQNSAGNTVTGATVRHDETAGLQAAIDYAFAQGGGRISLHEGTYRFTRIWLKDGVTISGIDRSGTKLVSYESVWPSIKAIGEGNSWSSGSGDVRNEYIDTWGMNNLTLTSAYSGVLSNLPFTRIGLELFLCHTVTVVNVDIRNHFLAVSERCSWYTHFENTKVEYNYNAWELPYFVVSATPSNHFNCVIKDNDGLGIYLNTPDVFNFVGGAVERNATGGIKILGGQTRTVTFDTTNIEANGGIPLEIGDLDGSAPSGIAFRNCSFKNWNTAKQACAIKLNRVVGFELTSPKFFNYEVAVDLSPGNSSFLITNPSYDGCTNYYKLEGNVLSAIYYLSVRGDWNGIIAETSYGWSQLLPTTKTISITQVADFIAAGGGGSGTITYQQRGYINAVLDFLVTGNGTTDDTTTLQASIDKSTELRLPLYIPAGNYKISAGLVVDSAKYTGTGDKNVMIYGAGGTATRIAPLSSTAYDIITIQNGSGGGSGVAPSGFIKDIFIEGPTSNAAGTNRGLLLRGMRQFEVHSITVKRIPIAFDMIDNCYGSVYYNCRAQLGAVGLNLRAGVTSGSDMNFYNFWLTGNTAGIQISPDGGGWHFFGGQISGGQFRSADDDDSGAVIIGKDLITAATGTASNIIFDGIDFEGIRHMHLFRSFGQVSMTVRNSSFLQTDTSGAGLIAAPLAIWKATGAQQSRVIFENNGMKGVWKSAKAIDITGNGSLIEIHERATMYETNTKFNNVAWTSAPMLVQSKCALGHAHWRDSWVSKYLVGGIIYREGSGKLEQSTDWGVTWTGISTTSLSADSVKIGGGTVSTGKFSTLLSAYSLASAIPGLSIPAHSTVDIDLTMASAAINDDVRVIIDNMATGLMWTSLITEAGKIKLRIGNITVSAIAIADTHNIRMTVQKFT